ncbi:SDR family oxidoreductase [Massilia sp. S19_KUP03_FR1]|uniref:SDR family oxidoreductase n=1 Tax=Massilia sp. S19_KUP03_FR1 TaxID=3025503 RepID=UPI002FCDA664
MTFKLKPVDEQVIVITGATSGIGLTTARMAAGRGARLVLAARNRDALDQLAAELRSRGTQVATVAADVGVAADVARIGSGAVEQFGRIDTWVNNAGISVYGRLEDTPLEDQLRVFQTNYWGVVHGTLEAVKHMRQRGGGAIVNLGSEVSDRAVPLQGTYSASKHAVKAFTDALRMELEREHVPISLTLVKPAAIDTLFPVHAKNLMDKEPALAPPVYAPELVARAILHAASHPVRDQFIGGAAKIISMSAQAMPRLMDRYMRNSMFTQQRSAKDTAAQRNDALHAVDPDQELKQRGTWQQRDGRHVVERSPYTTLSMKAGLAVPALVSAGVLFAGWRLAASILARRTARKEVDVVLGESSVGH